MNNIRLSVIAILINICVSGCCRYVDCLSDEYSCILVFKDKITGDDIIFGKNSTYNRNTMFCFSILNQDTIYYKVSFIEYNSAISDSVVSIIFYPETLDSIFLQYNETDYDTIFLKYNNFNTTCCGNITEITNANINTVDFQVNRNPILINK